MDELPDEALPGVATEVLADAEGAELIVSPAMTFSFSLPRSTSMTWPMPKPCPSRYTQDSAICACSVAS